MLVVAAGAFALVVSVVGACALPAGTGVLLPADVEDDAALWSVELGVCDAGFAGALALSPCAGA